MGKNVNLFWGWAVVQYSIVLDRIIDIEKRSVLYEFCTKENNS